jgi:iron complex outermembrane receptor protein
MLGVEKMREMIPKIVKTDLLSFKLLLCLGVLISVSAIPGTAVAQDESDSILEEIIVTALKREENLQTTAVSVSAMTGASLERKRVFSMFDLANTTPSFSLTANTALDLEMNIRGVTNTRLDSPTADPSVGFFMDDVYIGRTGGMNADFFDVERLEIIRGPQGVLLGKNVVGGALSVYSKKPEAETSGEIMVSRGNYSSSLVNGFFTGSLSESVMGRFSFQSRDRAGYGYNLLADRDLEDLDSKQYRAQLTYAPADGNFSSRLIVDYNKDSGNGPTVVAVPDSADTGFRPWSTLREFVGISDIRVSMAERSQYAGDDFFTEQYYEREGWGATLNMEWNLDGAILTSITANRDVETGQMYDQTGGGPDMFDALYDFADFQAFAGKRAGSEALGATLFFSEPVREDAEISQFSQEIRLASDTDSAMDWIVGVYYKKDEVDKLDRFIGENPSGALATLSGESHWDNRGEMESKAVFGQVGYQVTDAVKITIGGRYTEDDKKGYINGIQVATGDRFNPSDAAPLTPLQEPFSGGYGDTWSEFTPQAILEYNPSDVWYWYGSISTGFKGGGYEDTPANARAIIIPFDPETVMNYEIGFKANLMDKRMRLNASVFMMDYEDLQVQQTNEDCLCNITDNASDAEIKGLEVEFQYAITDTFILLASGSMLDTEYKDFLEASGVDSTGNKLQRTPDNQFSLGFDWNLGSGEYADTWTLNVNYYWQDELYWQPANANVEDSYGLLDGRLSYAPPESAWSVSAWIKNANDEEYRTNIIPFFGEEVGQYGAPRTYGVDLRISF